MNEHSKNPQDQTNEEEIGSLPEKGSIVIIVSEVTQSCPAFCDPTDCSPPGSSVHGILQARTLEWAAI